MKGRKILFLIHSLGGGGAERVTVDIAHACLEAGADVVIATMAPAGTRVYDLPEGAVLKSLDISGESRGVISGLANNFHRVRRLRQFLESEKPDIAVGMMSTAAILLALSRTNRISAIGAERNFPLRSLSGRLWPLLRRWGYGRLDVITVQTDEGKRWLLSNTRARHAAVIPNAVALPLAKHSPELNLRDHVPEGQHLLLSAGRLVPQKAFDRLISAFAQLASKHSDWTLAITGDGTDRAALQQQITNLGLTDRVILPGRAGNLADWYQAADIFALTSRYEGFPNVLVEALAHGCPAVSVDCDTGPRDIIRHEENGLLVPQDDPDALVAALDRLMSDEALRKRLAARAPEVLETFSPERVFAMWQELFEMQPRGGHR